MKTQVYSFRAAPGLVPAGVSTGDYVKSLASGGVITGASVVDARASMVVNIFLLFTLLTIIAQWMYIAKLRKQAKK